MEDRPDRRDLEVALLNARLEELTQALALTNERLNKILVANATYEYDELEKRTYIKLGIKKIEQMTLEEIRALNEEVSKRHVGKRATSPEAIEQSTYEEDVTRYSAISRGGYNGALLATLKNLIIEDVEGRKRAQGEEVTEDQLKEFVAKGQKNFLEEQRLAATRN